MNVIDDSASESSEGIELLHRFIQRLCELNKALVLLYLDGNSYKAISDVLGISETNVATKINRIKKKLGQDFAENP